MLADSSEIPAVKNSTTTIQPPANPRFYIWRQRVIYLGPAYQPRARFYDAPYLAFGFQGPMRFQIAGHEPVECRVALIPPATEVFFAVEGETYGILFLDYLGQDLKLMKALARQNHDFLYHDFGPELESAWLSEMARLHREDGGIESARRILDLLKFKCYESECQSDLTDQRLSRIIDLYLSGELSPNCRVSDAAAAVNLSVPRIVQLFREHLGISFKTFRSRQRMHRFMLAAAFGWSHCEAALEAGFVDQPHFCKHFKKSSGINASQYFLRDNKVSYYVEARVAEMFIRGSCSVIQPSTVPTPRQPVSTD